MLPFVVADESIESQCQKLVLILKFKMAGQLFTAHEELKKWPLESS